MFKQYVFMLISMYVQTYAIHYPMYVCVAITVRFNQSTYSVTENSGMIQLFLILSSPPFFNETVQLITNDDTAIGMINNCTCEYNMNVF